MKTSWGGHWALQYCGIGQFFLRYFRNYNLEMRYCGVLQTCDFLAFWTVLKLILLVLKRFPSLLQFPIGHS